MTERRTYDVGEVATLLGVSRDVIYDAVRRDELPVLRIGRRLVFPRARIDALLEAEPVDERG